MGKRKKSSRKPQGPKKVSPPPIPLPLVMLTRRQKREPLPSTFACLFCNHEKSVAVKLDKKVGIGQLFCKVCGQSFQTGINYLSAPVDVYSDWVDACDVVAKEQGDTQRDSAPTHRELERGPLPGKEPMERYLAGQDADEHEDYDEELYAEE
ncbi:hypothetical protein FGG08_004821 [Glutinoglossum americanum]|uniref:Transcription elongation factor 1 homolog n=1 Tax=Glutinoglossum americanum TaxID=1670608 RepID=A0A9P8KWP0_9PEZI|nr:hypothetical protein FGG08_004821 [Glutinoglossum americanum]